MQTVISVFQDRLAAQRAVDRLMQAGFERDQVHLQEGAAPANTATASTPGTTASGDLDPDRGVLSSIGHFFVSVFGGQDPPSGYADRYLDEVRRGHSLVVVEASDDEAADRASTIVRQLGASDIAEHAAEWKDADMKAGTSSSTGGVMGTGPRMQAPERERQDGTTARSERERAVAADPARETPEHENDIEAREDRVKPTRRDV